MFERRGETSTESCFLFYGPSHEIHRKTTGNDVTFDKAALFFMDPVTKFIARRQVVTSRFDKKGVR